MSDIGTANPGNVIGGHKAAIHNPNTSQEAKEHSKEVLEEQYNLNPEGKDLSHVAGGLKSALHNPNVSEEAKESARERLEEMK